MSKLLDELTKRALKLPVEERLRLLDKLHEGSDVHSHYDLEAAALVLSPDEVHALSNNYNISCIKRIRDRTGVGLGLAVAMVEEFRL